MASADFRRRLRFLPVGIIIVLLVLGAVFRLSLYNKSQLSMRMTTVTRGILADLSTEATCVREVLRALNLPLTRRDYFLQPLEHPLDLTLLSSSCQTFLIPQNVSDKRKKELECFRPGYKRFGSLDRGRLKDALLLVRDNFDRARILIAMTYGTSLASWRMHGQIPYDYDIDLFVLRRHKSRAIEVMTTLRRIHPHLFKTYWFDVFWRLDLKRHDGSELTKIDVFFHKLRSTDKVIEKDHRPFKLDARTLLPLVQRPFEGVLLKTWRNTKEYLQKQFGNASDITCKTTITKKMSNPKEYCDVTAVRCSELNYFFNFAKRWEQEDGKLVEVLFNRSHALSVFYSPEGV